ncbi:acetyltransferase [Litchfieldia alkalitelluris]|uniref:acetyltransferase n=1 Tax=Litchfieldia alkalitelluris TaxID=304268 RepID=UPI000998A9D3|nr:acetyltransferase [Litchfieldia alkalitelluris]
MNIGIIGQGGHSKVIKDIIIQSNEYEIRYIFDDKFDSVMENGKVIYGPISLVSKILPHEKIKFIIAIGDNEKRKIISNRLKLSDSSYITLKHHAAVISPSAKIGAGSVVMANSVINADSCIGKHCIINSSSTIEHDNSILDFVHVSPGVTLSGTVRLDEGVHVGAGATIIPGVRVGNWTKIGAGATVINDIPSYCTAIGVPAKVKVKEGA